MWMEQVTQAVGFADVVNYQSVNNTSVNSLGIDMSKFKRALFLTLLPQAGPTGQGALNVALQISNTSNFAINTTLTTSNFTTAANLSVNNTFSTLEIRADQMAYLQSQARYVRLYLTASGQALNCAGFGFGFEAIQKPGGVGSLSGNLNTTYLAASAVVNSPSP
jgi:hypothetical protein